MKIGRTKGSRPQACIANLGGIADNLGGLLIDGQGRRCDWALRIGHRDKLWLPLMTRPRASLDGHPPRRDRTDRGWQGLTSAASPPFAFSRAEAVATD